ncbi:MAG: hypothetical protein Q4D62_12110 [Planctomycetia bacterium]|nr:hypothetical protein [Planctomycetia bacterium]
MRVLQVSLSTITGIVLLGSVCCESLFAAPPSRQTPYLVSRDKQGVVEVGPCQLPPAVGGQPCTPNARDFGYFEGTWRKWPTQQRYDQNFPQAIGATPIQPKAVRPAREVPIAPDSTASPYQSPGNTQEFTLPEIVPDNLPGNLSVPSSNPPSGKSDSVESTLLPMITPESGFGQQGDTPSSGPAPTTLPEIESPEATEEEGIPALDTQIPEEDISLPLPSASTAPAAPQQAPAAPLEDSETLPGISAGGEKDTETLPGISTSETGMQSVLNSVSQQTPPVPATSEETSVSESLQTLNPFEKSAALRNSHSVAVSPVTITPVSPALPIPANWDEKELTAPGENVAQTSFATPATASMPEMPTTGEMVLGLEGFCPVTLLRSEQWVEGESRWSVVHHGITYHLASADLVPLFLSNPQQFTPVSDGKDPVTLRDSGQEVAGSADYCVVYEGKLYMFATETTMNQFFENADRYR